MIARIQATTLLTLRLLARSRGLTALAGLLLVIVAGLPQILSGDGTAEGNLRILIQYPISAIMALLVPVTLLGACALPSTESASGRFQLTWIKPARTWEIWTGQWIGLTLINAALLAGALAAVCLAATIHSARYSDLVPRGLQPSVTLRPVLPDIRQSAREVLDEMRTAGKLPSDMPEETVLDALSRRIRAAHLPLAPGETLNAVFHLPRKLRMGETIAVHLTVRSTSGMLSDLKGDLSLHGMDGERGITKPVDEVARGELSFPVAVDESLDGCERLALRFRRDDADNAMAFLYNPRQGLTLSLSHGSAWSNVLRAGLILLSLLMLVAALGLTVGNMFSFPVAAFLAAAVLLSCAAARFAVSEGAGTGAASSASPIYARISAGIVKWVTWSTRPVVGYHPSDSLATRSWIETGTLLRSVLWRACVYPFLLGALACAALHRGEPAG